MSAKKYLDNDGLLYLKQKLDGRFVAKDGAKVLSTNDYTNADKNKLSDIATGAQVNKIDTVKVNGTDLVPDQNKAVNIVVPTVPTKVSDLTNDSNFKTQSEVEGMISSAISDITGISFEIVSSLPTTGVAGVIYLMSNGGTNPNVYDEYVWISSTNKFEKLGTTDIDLSSYVQDTDLVAITNSEIDTIVAA